MRLLAVKLKCMKCLGSTCNLYVNCNGVQITAAVDPSTAARVGDTIQLAFNTEYIQIFDKETENNILVDVDPTTGQLVFNA